MSFTRANPGGWAVGDRVTTAQLNQLDIDHSNSFDCVAGAGLISGPCTWTGASAAIIIAASAKIDNSGALNIKNGATLSCQSGSTTTYASGCALQVNAGATCTMVLTASSTVTIGSTGSLITTGTGNITLGNGPTDIKLTGGTTKTAVVSTATSRPARSTDWTFNFALTPVAIQNAATPSGQTSGSTFLTRIHAHSGATLSSVTMAIGVGAGHNGDAVAPQNMPQWDVRRITIATGAYVSLRAAGAITLPTPASGTAWYNSGNPQTFTFTPDQNNTALDPTNYDYVIVVSDEWGTHTYTANDFIGFTLSFTAIADMRFAQ